MHTTRISIVAVVFIITSVQCSSARSKNVCPGGMSRAAVLAGLLMLPCLVIASRELQGDRVGASIVGGFAAVQGRFPYMVSLRFNDGRGRSHRCGGSLIHPSLVLTAAHCIVDIETGKLLPPSTSLPIVRIGAYRRTLDGPADYELRRAIRAVPHPAFVWGYRRDMLNNDLALLVLDTPSTRAVVQLPPHTPKPGLPSYRELHALGWGRTTPEQVPGSPNLAEELQQLRMKLLPLWQCASRWSGIAYFDRAGQRRNVSIGWTSANNSMLCAVSLDFPTPQRRSACNGDSGGPHIALGATAGEDVVLGVESFGQRPCGVMDGLANAAQLRPWIGAAVSLLTATSWVGSVVGGQRMQGFMGGPVKVGTLPAGSTVNLLSTRGANGTQVTALLGPPAFWWQAPVVTSLNLTGATPVKFTASQNSLSVVVGGQALLPNQTQSTPGGSVVFRAAQAGWPLFVTVQQPGLVMNVVLPWVAATRQLASWLDVTIRLTHAPVPPPGGVLGATFPRI